VTEYARTDRLAVFDEEGMRAIRRMTRVALSAPSKKIRKVARRFLDCDLVPSIAIEPFADVKEMASRLTH
jgi:hypothetical protein